VLASHSDQCGTRLRLTLLAGEPLSWSCCGHKRSLSDDCHCDPSMVAGARLKTLWTSVIPAPCGTR
jgi:hypothetical protein